MFLATLSNAHILPTPPSTFPPFLYPNPCTSLFPYFCCLNSSIFHFLLHTSTSPPSIPLFFISNSTPSFIFLHSPFHHPLHSSPSLYASCSVVPTSSLPPDLGHSSPLPLPHCAFLTRFTMSLPSPFPPFQSQPCTSPPHSPISVPQWFFTQPGLRALVSSVMKGLRLVHRKMNTNMHTHTHAYVI